MPKLVIAATVAAMLAVPGPADAQSRGNDQPRQQQQQDTRRGGGFQGMLRDIAGARLDRAHATQRSDRPDRPDRKGDKNQKRR